MRWKCLALSVFLGLAGCGLTSEACATIQSTALAVKVNDATTGQPLDYTQDGIRVPDSGSCNRPITQFITVSLQPI